MTVSIKIHITLITIIDITIVTVVFENFILGLLNVITKYSISQTIKTTKLEIVDIFIYLFSSKNCINSSDNSCIDSNSIIRNVKLHIHTFWGKSLFPKSVESLLKKTKRRKKCIKNNIALITLAVSTCDERSIKWRG